VTGAGARPPHHEWLRGEHRVSTDPAEIQLDVVHGFLATSYWAEGVPRETVARSIAGSLPFGLYRGANQVGFARVVTDRATFAWVCDVFVLEEERGRGLARWMLECARATPELQGLRRWLLATRDAHALYASLGFVPLAAPERWMEIATPGAHRR
jgi:GNAT superfamily N-acetyltransferase